ncbi:hypothetical protein ABZ635_08440 [Nocardiopsis sp. NPDC007018]|uniref:hypothetical protein n=1 Tax=Nocardiopsis sp. NPDC007018 TaxID=3155721 RepID=UPI0033D46A0E
MGWRAWLLVGGLFSATMGQRFADIAFALHAVQLGSSAFLAAVLLASAIPGLLFGLVGGVVADRSPRWWWWPLGLTLQAGVFLTLARLDAPWHLVAGVAVSSTIGAVLGPVGSKLLGSLARGHENRAARANTAATGTAAVLGTALGGVSFALGSRGTLLAVTGCALLVLALCGAVAHHRGSVTTERAASDAGAWVGFRRLASPAVFGTAGTLCVVGVVLGTSVEAVSGVFVLTGFVGVGEAGYGFAVASWAAGIVAGGALFGGLAPHRLSMPLSAVGMGAMIALPAVVAVPWAAVASFGVGGVCNGVFNTALATAIWTRVAPSEHGRAWAAFRWTVTYCLLAGYVAGALAGTGGARLLVLTSGGAAALAGAAFLAVRVRDGRGHPPAPSTDSVSGTTAPGLRRHG